MPFPPIICTSVVKVKVSTHQTLSTLPPEPRAKKQNKKHSAKKNKKTKQKNPTQYQKSANLEFFFFKKKKPKVLNVKVFPPTPQEKLGRFAQIPSVIQIPLEITNKKKEKYGKF